MMMPNNPLCSRFSNMTTLKESDFNITAPGIYIWPGEFPYKRGDTFPTDEIRKRADQYLTNKMLYLNKFDGIMDNVFSWADYWQNPVTNWPNMAIIADLPDFNVTTEAWVELISARSPRVISSVNNDDSAENQQINRDLEYVSDVLQNSNFAVEVQDIIRKAYCIYGNKVVRVNRLAGGGVNIIDMPVKCWIPWVDQNDITSIKVNMFFSICDLPELGRCCQFLCYYEDGKIEKRTFKYSANCLGDEIGEPEVTKAFNADVSPIVVFTGENGSDTTFGHGQFQSWDAAIAFSVRSFEALGVLIEQMKEIYRVLPDGATRTDEDTGITYNTNTGAIVYKGESAPAVDIKKAQLQLDQAINTYNTALKRVAKDTGLPISYFDESTLGANLSAESLRTSMVRSAQKAEKIISIFKADIKKLVVRMAMAAGRDIDISDFDLRFRTGFIVDSDAQVKTLQARTGNAVTMSVAEAIAAYDDISISQAQRKANELAGIKNKDTSSPGIENTTSGGESVVDNGVNFEHVSDEPVVVTPITESPIGLI